MISETPLICMILPFGCKVNLRQIAYRHLSPNRSGLSLINYISFITDALNLQSAWAAQQPSGEWMRILPMEYERSFLNSIDLLREDWPGNGIPVRFLSMQE